jgi:dolichyl-phosphate beta-glucosyltransferase
MDLSIIVPAYNEEKRIMPFLADLLKVSKKLRKYEILFVNDGSTDGTLKILQGASKKNRNIRIITYRNNRGKGYAVKQGVMKARGNKVLFIDADGSINPEAIPQMQGALDRYDFVWGNRGNELSEVSQPALRRLTSSLFNPFVELLFSNRIADNLCGFKGFGREKAKMLFSEMKSNDWIFDVELFSLARKHNIRMGDLPVKWTHKGGSKMNLATPFRMGFKLIKLKAGLKR